MWNYYNIENGTEVETSKHSVWGWNKHVYTEKGQQLVVYWHNGDPASQYAYECQLNSSQNLRDLKSELNK